MKLLAKTDSLVGFETYQKQSEVLKKKQCAHQQTDLTRWEAANRRVWQTISKTCGLHSALEWKLYVLLLFTLQYLTDNPVSYTSFHYSFTLSLQGSVFTSSSSRQFFISSDSSFHPLGLSGLFCVICLLRHFTSMLQEKQLIHYQYFHSTVFPCCLLFLVPVSWTVLNSFNTYFDFFFFAVAIF